MGINENDWALTEQTNGIAFNTIIKHLEENLGDADYSRTLRKSPYERAKASANLEYARTLLVKIEHNDKNLPPGKKQKGQAVTHYRSVLKTLEDRLYELNQVAYQASANGIGEESSDDDGGAEEVQELLRRYGPAVTVPSSSSGIDTEREENEDSADMEVSDARTQAAAATLTSTLRSRRPNTTTQPSTATATTTGSTTSPFAPRPESSSGQSTTDTLLTSHTLTQEELTTSLLDLAKALNKSTQSFSVALEGSNPLVDRATAALDKSVGGMEAAERRMGMLRKMTEGRGWFGRLSLWAWVAVGWAVMFFVMFIMPKLRM